MGVIVTFHRRNSAGAPSRFFIYTWTSVAWPSLIGIRIREDIFWFLLSSCRRTRGYVFTTYRIIVIEITARVDVWFQFSRLQGNESGYRMDVRGLVDSLRMCASILNIPPLSPCKSYPRIVFLIPSLPSHQIFFCHLLLQWYRTLSERYVPCS